MSEAKQELPGVIKAIHTLQRSTVIECSAVTQVRQAFLFGLWYRSFPDYMVEDLGTLYSWDLLDIDPQAAKDFGAPDNGFKFQFISDTGDSWHQCYRDLRSLGWRRLKVHRKGGRLQYLFKIEASAAGMEGCMPIGFEELHLLLDISISTCKQVQVGTKMEEVPIFETKCEDLVELPEDKLVSSGSVEEAAATVNKIASEPEPEVLEQHTGHHDKDSIPF